jgi:hypothetical protein
MNEPAVVAQVCTQRSHRPDPRQGAGGLGSPGSSCKFVTAGSPERNSLARKAHCAAQRAPRDPSAIGTLQTRCDTWIGAFPDAQYRPVRSALGVGNRDESTWAGLEILS